MTRNHSICLILLGLINSTIGYWGYNKAQPHSHYHKPPAVAMDCPNQDLPVCSTEGKSYQNRCWLEKAGASYAYEGWCKTTPATIPPHPAPPSNGVCLPPVFNQCPDNGYPDNYYGRECPCNNVLNPVCGENGITYANACRAAAVNVKPVSYGECRCFENKGQIRGTCSCSQSSQTACGEDDTTYESQCVATCMGVTTKHIGACASPCGCVFYFKPVCGTDGRNYANQCEMDCVGACKYADGLCCESQKCNECFGEIKRVCGKDGETYDNACYARCNGTEVDYEGKCVDPDDCVCPSYYLPVCGMDGKTYENECQALCAGCRNFTKGKCKKEEIDPDMCRSKCYKMPYKPVCGTNRITYYNESMIECDSGITVLYEGECKPIYVGSCECPNKVDPVCGADGRTYLNRCVLEYVGVDMYCVGTCELDGNGWEMTVSPNYNHYDYAADNTWEEEEISWKSENPYYEEESHEGCYGNKCEKKRNRCCDVRHTHCCMNDDGTCCDGPYKPPVTYEFAWDCNYNDCNCKPKQKVYYKKVSRKCNKPWCKKPVRKGYSCTLPYVPACDYFDFKNFGSNYNFMGDFFPEPRLVKETLVTGYNNFNKHHHNHEDKVDLTALLKNMFGKKKQYKENKKGVELFITLDKDEGDDYNDNIDVDVFRKKIVDNNICRIPEDHQKIIRAHAVSYYVYFYVLLEKNLCTEDTEVIVGYTVKDVLIFIIEDCWGLELGQAKGINIEHNIDFDSVSLDELRGSFSGKRGFSVGSNGD